MGAGCTNKMLSVSAQGIIGLHVSVSDFHTTFARTDAQTEVRKL